MRLRCDLGVGTPGECVEVLWSIGPVRPVDDRDAGGDELCHLRFDECFVGTIFPEPLEEVIESSSLLRRHDEFLDGVGVVVEFGNSCGLLERQEVVPFGGCFGEVGSNDAEGCVNLAALDLGPLGDLCG